MGDLALTHRIDDQWYWTLDQIGVFSVKTSSSLVQNKILDEVDGVPRFKWNSWVPGKINMCLASGFE